MIRSSHGTHRLRRSLLIGALAALVPVTAGCEAGSAHQTLKWHEAGNGAYATAGQVKVINAFVLGPKLGGTLPAGSSASVFLSLYNGGASADKLVSVAAPGTAATVTVSGGQVAIPPQGAAYLTGPRPRIVLRHITAPLKGGATVHLVLSFANAGSLNITAPVQDRASYYSTYSPPAPASGAASRPRGGHGHAVGSGRGRASGTPKPSTGKSRAPRPSPTG